MSAYSGDEQGVIFRKDPGRYSVRSQGRDIACILSSRLYKEITLPQGGPLAVGDRVQFVENVDGSGTITAILPRSTCFSRQATTPGRHVLEQVIVANIEQVVPVFSAASPAPKWGLLDRYLVAAEAAGLRALICLTKTDLLREPVGLEATLSEYSAIGYEIRPVSVVTGAGLDELKRALAGRSSVLVGKSGVGKSSLLNALCPASNQRVRDVSRGKLGKGRHTTTGLEMFALGGGATIVDTPGIREFGLWDVAPDELALSFPEMRPLVGTCRFGLDCRHDEEPGCGIRKAVAAGTISPYRYRSYLKLRGLA